MGGGLEGMGAIVSPAEAGVQKIRARRPGLRKTEERLDAFVGRASSRSQALPGNACREALPPIKGGHRPPYEGNSA
jgi:hypothetical protein